MSGSDDDSENTRFPCLATVRYAIATVVGVVAVTVVIMVIIVVRRPQEIRLSVYHGYISAYGSTLRVNFRFNNPSGRGDIDCSNIIVGVLDMNATDIVQFELGSFSVSAQTTLTVTQLVPISNPRQRRYIRDRYFEEDSFRVAVVVRVSLSKKSSKAAAVGASLGKKSSNAAASVPPKSMGKPIRRTLYCWPVSVRLFYDSSLYSTDDVACIKSANGEFPQQNSFSPAPAPAIEAG